MPLGEPKGLTAIRSFVLEPGHPKQRMYEALRAYFVEGRPSYEVVARVFGYTPGSFRVLCHQFRRDADPQFFASSTPGPREQPKKDAARALIETLRKQNYSVYEISEILKEQGRPLSPTAVREVLKELGFAALPRRLDEERPAYPRPTVEAVADVRSFSLVPRRFQTRCGGLFLFLPELVRLELSALAARARLPGSKMIPAAHALRACVALKLWSLERKSHVMALVADEGLGLFCGLNCIPKKSYFAEYSERIDHRKTTQLLGAWHERLTATEPLPGCSFDLDFHSVPYQGEHPVIERHYVSARSRRQPSVLVFLAQDAEARAFCYSNADLRKGGETEEVFRFVQFWKKHHGAYPAHLVFDSRLTTQANLARLDRMDITFITLRRRSPRLLAEIQVLPASAWRRVRLDVPTRKYRTPRVYEQIVRLEERTLRQLYVLDLGHEQPTILWTNERRSAAKLITRYAQRMLIENAISDAVRFFHIDALSSAVGMRVDFDLALLVIASGLYRNLARRMRGYADRQARQIFRDLIDMPAEVRIGEHEVSVHFHRRAHLPIILASGLMDQPVPIPWWNEQAAAPDHLARLHTRFVRSIPVRGNPG
jgi:transposase